MEFSNIDFLDIRDIELLITSDFPNEKAEAISKKLIKYCVIHNKELYVLQKNITYRKNDSDIKIELTKMTTLLIEQSFKALEKKDTEILKLTYKKEYKTIFQNSFIEKIYAQLYMNLQKTDIVFDLNLYEIHFNNGYFDLKTNEFKNRIVNTHYITQYINRDYIKSNDLQRKKIMKHIKKIYPNKDDLNCILLILGSALSGKSNVDQDTLFLLGEGSSGKSFTLSLTKETIECYFKELQNDTFSQSNTKIDKILNTYSSNPQIRISWINEMKDTKMDECLFKSFCEGKLQTTQLYKDGSQSIPHYSKCIITANTMPNIKIDSGVERRFKGYTHKSKFVGDDDKDKVDENKHIYLKDTLLLDKIIQKGLLNAWFDILADKCNEWLNGEKIKFNENFEETKSTVMLSNDIIQDFIDSKITKTKSQDDRIGKNRMHSEFSKMYPNKHLSPLQVITALKEKGIEYQSKLRADNIQGCFVCVKFHWIQELDELDNSPSTLINYPELDGTNFKKLYEESQERIRELEEELNKLKNPIKKIKKVIKKEINEFDELDELQAKQNN